MNTLLIACLLGIGISHAAQLLSLSSCTADSQCGAGECCAIPSAHPIMSKRQDPVQATTGSCMRYKKLGDSCNVFDKANGYCGCESGSHCVFERTDIRRSPPMWPGRTLCKAN